MRTMMILLAGMMAACNGATSGGHGGEGGSGGEGGEECLHPTPNADGEPPVYTEIDECDCKRVGYDYFRASREEVQPGEHCVIQNPTTQFCCYN